MLFLGYFLNSVSSGKKDKDIEDLLYNSQGMDPWVPVTYQRWDLENFNICPTETGLCTRKAPVAREDLIVHCARGIWGGSCPPKLEFQDPGLFW